MAYNTKNIQQAVAEVRSKAERSLSFFARLVNPHRVYGSVHDELFNWWTRQAAADNQLALIPRDHQKSHCAAVYAAWLITKYPWITIQYISATADLAEKQLFAIKSMLDSKVYRRYWPDMIHPEEGKRTIWNVAEIAVDHPARVAEGVRDPTVKASGLTGNITGFHANHIFLDDIVVPNNAYSEEGRTKVYNLYSQLASVKTTGAKTTVVGTRYHPKDIYGIIQERMVDIYEDGILARQEPLYEVLQYAVEEDGEFLWPRKQRSDGRWFGFDENELAKKRAEYIDKTQFYAQYYNNPNNPDVFFIKPDYFQYYDKRFLKQEDGWWWYKDKKLNIFAAIDFAYSLKKHADWTSIVVLGIDSDGFYYILAIERFKTDSIKEYFDHILRLHQKWGFRKIRAEITAAQEVIVKELKDNYIRKFGLALSIDEHRPTRHEGHKEERMAATLKPRYENRSVFHYKGGYCDLLEEELILEKPAHDDIKDALTAAMDIAVAPSNRSQRSRQQSAVLYHPKFGGVRI